MDDEEGATLQPLQGHWITYRIAMGPQAGRKVLTACAARCKQFLQPLRYRQARLELTDQGMASYALKTAYLRGPDRGWDYACECSKRGGLPPLDFMVKLAALVPRPRFEVLTRFHGVLVTEQSVPRKRNAAKYSQGKTCHADVEADGREEPKLERAGAVRAKLCCTLQGRPKAKRLKRVYAMGPPLCPWVQV